MVCASHQGRASRFWQCHMAILSAVAHAGRFIRSLPLLLGFERPPANDGPFREGVWEEEEEVEEVLQVPCKEAI